MKAPNDTDDGFLLRVNGITYDIPYSSALPGTALHDEDLGPKVGEVSPEMNRESTSPTTTYSALPDEVPVYAIKGYDPSFRVTARMNDRLMPFQVLYNSKAEEGSDVLDIGGKVRSISIFHWKFSLAGGGRLHRGPRKGATSGPEPHGCTPENHRPRLLLWGKT